MGVSIYAKNSSYDFHMGYGGFFNLRKNIAIALDEEFGENYALLSKCMTLDDFKENDKKANHIINRKNLNNDYEDVIDFLYQSDSNGQISYKTCKKIYDLIKDIDFSGKGFRYAAYSKNDYDDFKLFLKECYSKRRYMRWS